MKGKTTIFIGSGVIIGFITGCLFITASRKCNTLAESIADKVTDLVFEKIKNPRSVSYSRYWDYGYRKSHQVKNDTYTVHEIIFDSRKIAESVLHNMQNMVKQYGCVSIADYYELSGNTETSYYESKYGWFNLESTEVSRCCDILTKGWKIKLSDPVPLN